MSYKTFQQSPSAQGDPGADLARFMPNILVMDFIGNEHFWRSKIDPKLSIVEVAQLRNKNIVEKFSLSGKGEAAMDAHYPATEDEHVTSSGEKKQGFLCS